MKKIAMSLCMLLCVTIMLGMPAGALAGKKMVVGISKIVAHPALDALEKGVQDGVRETYPDARFDLQNANGEISTASSIARKFKAQGVDAAVGIATPTAQALVNTLKKSPVIYCAVTDPVGAGLIASTEKGEKNVTGTSDMTPVREQISFLKRVAGIKTLGHIYSSSEANAVSLAEIARDVCRDLDIKFVETTVTNSSEVKQAVQSIAGRVDGIYLSNDNTVFSALSAVTEVARKHKIPVMSADPSSALDHEVLAAWGFDYYKMGVVTGRITARVLGGEKAENIPTVFMTEPSDVDLLINLDSAAYLGLEIPDDILQTAGTIIRDGRVEKK